MNQFREFLYYTKSERNAFLLVTLLIVLLKLSLLFFEFPGPEDSSAMKEWQSSVQAFEKSLFTTKKVQKARVIHSSATGLFSKSLTLFDFDPNKIDRRGLKKIGLSDYVLNNLLNYRQKGGRFKKIEDVAKIYGMQPDQFDQLKHYIKFESAAKVASDSFNKSVVAAFCFDPNTLSADSFELLGLSEKVIKRVINYRQKGGQFRNKLDFGKIYDLTPQMYKLLEQKIQINPVWKNKPYTVLKSYRLMDINTASYDDWQQFKGIGPSFSRRILKYKMALGGFVDVAQVAEVFMLPDSVYQFIQPYLLCNNPKPTQININEATIETLQAHPYLRWFHAKAILKYRELKGDWPSIDLLQILPEFDDNKHTFYRVKLYLCNQ